MALPQNFYGQEAEIRKDIHNQVCGDVCVRLAHSTKQCEDKNVG